jgi:hypothetical protein
MVTTAAKTPMKRYNNDGNNNNDCKDNDEGYDGEGNNYDDNNKQNTPLSL